MAGLETCSGGIRRPSPHTHNLKKFELLKKEPNRKAVFRSDGGPPEFCYHSLQKIFTECITQPQPWQAAAPGSNLQLVTVFSLTKVNTRCKPLTRCKLLIDTAL
jgi:hypothetical protein